MSNVLMIGGSGFVGRYVAAELVKSGKRITVVSRRRERAKHLLTLPTVDVIEADVHAEGALERIMPGHDAIINLVGILHGDGGDPYGNAFRRAHVDLPSRLVQLAERLGIKRYLHMSALGVTDNRAPSMYLRSKADGEKPVRLSELAWTIFRPSVIFGPEDSFLNRFAQIMSLTPVIPLAGAGVRFQPVYVSDVARAFAYALDHPTTTEKTFELAGPKVYTLKALMQFVAKATGRRRCVLPIPKLAGYLQALLMECLPGEPIMSRDNLASMAIDNVARLPWPKEFGFDPSALEPIAEQYLADGLVPKPLDVFRGRAHRS